MVQKFKTLADAVALAEYAHRNQLDKAGLPYIEHPKRVLQTVQAQGVQPFVQIAAVLHDVTEDTAFTSDILLDLGFSEAAVDLVRRLDRDYSDWYHFSSEGPLNYSMDGTKEQKDYFYYARIKESRDATIIKLADIRDNMSPWRQAYLTQETQDRLRAKYAKALEILNPKPVNHGFIDPNYVFDPYHLR
jgi:(p)ppGpp synthase/HD superfamily hydrolase